MNTDFDEMDAFPVEKDTLFEFSARNSDANIREFRKGKFVPSDQWLQRRRRRVSFSRLDFQETWRDRRPLNWGSRYYTPGLKKEFEP